MAKRIKVKVASVAKSKHVPSGAVKTQRRSTNAMESKNGETIVQLATRVPKAIYRELKLYAVTNSQSISDLVGEAITDLLKKKGWQFKKAS